MTGGGEVPVSGTLSRVEYMSRWGDLRSPINPGRGRHQKRV